jgi:hypothetical protein
MLQDAPLSGVNLPVPFLVGSLARCLRSAVSRSRCRRLQRSCALSSPPDATRSSGRSTARKPSRSWPISTQARPGLCRARCCRICDLQCVQGPRMTELLVGLGLIAGVVGAHEIGFWLGALSRSADDPWTPYWKATGTILRGMLFALIGKASDAVRRSTRGFARFGQLEQLLLNRSIYRIWQPLMRSLASSLMLGDALTTRWRK